MTENTAIETTEPKAAAQKMLRVLDAMAPKLQEAAAEGMDAKRLIRVFGGLATRNPKIYECSPESVVNCMVLCAQTGLEPGGYPPLVDLIPRRNKGTMELNWQIGYRGLIHLGQRSRDVVRVAASAVYDWEIAGGLFSYQIEPPILLHRASLDTEPGPTEAKNVIGAYAVAELASGGRAQIFLNKSQIEQRRRCAQDQTIWNANYPAMSRKSAIRALFSGGTVPMQRELRYALEADPEGELTAMVPDAPAVPAPRLATSRTMFSPPTVSPAPIEAEVVTQELQSEPEPPRRTRTTKPKPEPTPAPAIYQVARQAAAEMGVSAPDFEAAARVEMVPQAPEQWTQDDADRVLNALERARGA